MCHESSGAGLTETIGIGKGTVTLDDFNNASLIVVMGQNPGTIIQECFLHWNQIKKMEEK